MVHLVFVSDRPRKTKPLYKHATTGYLVFVCYSRDPMQELHKCSEAGYN